MNNEADKVTIEQIYDEYYSLMLYIASSRLEDHALAEDVVSESFIKIMKHLGKFQDAASHQVKGYVVNIVRTTSLDFLRKRKREQDYVDLGESDEQLEYVPDASIRIMDGMIVNEWRESMKEAIKILPETLKHVTYLAWVHGFGHDEIAQQLGISLATSKKRLSRARQEIKKILTGDLQ